MDIFLSCLSCIHMTDDLETVQAGILRIIGKSGNTTNAYMKDAKTALEQLENALDTRQRTVHLVGMDEHKNEIPFVVVMEDVIMVMLFPPPSTLALVPPGTTITPVKGPRPA